MGNGRGATGQNGNVCGKSGFAARGGIRLREVQVRTVRCEEELLWNAFLRERHYLGCRNFCGGRRCLSAPMALPADDTALGP